MNVPWQLTKHIGIPLGVGAGMYALRMPAHESEETLRHKWERTRDAWGTGGGLTGLAAGHTLGKKLGMKPSARALSMVLGGAGGALLGTHVAAPAHHLEEVRIRKARAAFPGGYNPATGAPVYAPPGSLDMDPAQAYHTQRWGFQ